MRPDLPKGDFNLPPGVSVKDIDEAAGDDCEESEPKLYECDGCGRLTPEWTCNSCAMKANRNRDY